MDKCCTQRVTKVYQEGFMLLLPSAKHKRIHFKSLFLLLLVKKSSYQPGFFKLPFLFFNSQSLLFHLIRWDLMQRLCQHFTEHRLDMHNAFPKESKVAKQTLVIIMESIMHSFTMTEWSTTLTPKCNKLILVWWIKYGTLKTYTRAAEA